jgi:predicted transcriptional regulator
VARLNSMPTVPDDVMVDGVSRSWSCLEIQAERTEHPAADSESRDAFTIASKMQSPTGYVRANVSGRTVAEIMRVPTKLSEGATLAGAAELFASGRIRQAVVVTKENKPIGVLTPAHVLRTVKERSSDQLGNVTVLEAATSGGAFLCDTTSIREAAERFATDDRDALVVVARDGSLAGVLMACDLPLVVDWV